MSVDDDLNQANMQPETEYQTIRESVLGTFEQNQEESNIFHRISDITDKLSAIEIEKNVSNLITLGILHFITDLQAMSEFLKKVPLSSWGDESRENYLQVNSTTSSAIKNFRKTGDSDQISCYDYLLFIDQILDSNIKIEDILKLMEAEEDKLAGQLDTIDFSRQIVTQNNSYSLERLIDLTILNFSKNKHCYEVSEFELISISYNEMWDLLKKAILGDTQET